MSWCLRRAYHVLELFCRACGRRLNVGARGVRPQRLTLLATWDNRPRDLGAAPVPSLPARSGRIENKACSEPALMTGTLGYLLVGCLSVNGLFTAAKVSLNYG